MIVEISCFIGKITDRKKRIDMPLSVICHDFPESSETLKEHHIFFIVKSLKEDQ